MTLERFELDFTPHATDEKHELVLSELISNVVRDYHAEHPELRRKDIQNAFRRVDADLLNESEGGTELILEAPRVSDPSRRFLSMTGVLVLLSSIAMFVVWMLTRRP
jgi:hypothetical protein